MGNYENKVALYSDDVILFLKDLNNSISALLSHIKTFGDISGYQVNNSKSSIMVLGEEVGTQINQCAGQFKTIDTFTYLGIKIKNDIGKIFSINYDPLLEQVFKLLERWTVLPISLLGSISLLKMSNLPKCLYFFKTYHCLHQINFFRV